MTGNASSITGITTAPLTTVSGTSDETGTTPTTGEPTGTGTATTPDPTTPDPTAPDPTTSDDTTGAVSDGTTTPTTDTMTGDPTGQPPLCETQLNAIVRDFSDEHPDFETYLSDAEGLVLPNLGPDHKPVHASPGPTEATSGPETFQQWYNDVPGVNQTFQVQLQLTEIQPGLYQYINNNFFPIDNQGFGNQDNDHNFHFTTEIHTEFVYNGGEVFTFTGDDDLWTFINGKLAIDLGGVHEELTKSIDLDANAAQFGIVKGGSYPMDIFHAERHTDESNFRIDTTISCFVVPG